MVFFGGADATIGNAIIDVSVPQNPNDGFPIWGIALIVLAAIIVLFGIATVYIKVS